VILPYVHLLRIENNFQYGVFGVLLISGEVFCATLEPKEFENAPSISCIPYGQYYCERIRSPKFGITVYEVCNVPGRTDILMHPGNVAEDTEGCILLGQYWGKLKDNRAILNSGLTFTKFMNIMASYAKFKLSIKEVW